MGALQRLERFGIDAQTVEMGVLPNGVRKERFAIVVEERPASIGHDTEVCPLRIHAHHPTITAMKEVQLDAAIQSGGRAEVRLKCNMSVASRRLAHKARAPRCHGMPTISADDGRSRLVAP